MCLEINHNNNNNLYHATKAFLINIRPEIKKCAIIKKQRIKKNRSSFFENTYNAQDKHLCLRKTKKS